MKIFMTGASGYIGGTVADSLIKAGHSVAGLARAESSAAKLRAHGIEPVSGELSAHSVVRNAARTADAVINCADAADPFVVAAIVEGLAGSGKAFLHTSGSSVIGDKAVGKFSPKIHHEDTPAEPLPEKIQRVAAFPATSVRERTSGPRCMSRTWPVPTCSRSKQRPPDRSITSKTARRA